MSLYNRRHREQGLCLYCPQPAAPDRSLCEQHLIKARERSKAKRKRGICSSCSEKVSPGHRKCESCLKKKSVHTRNRNERLKSQGLCMSCEVQKAVQDKTKCENCLKKHRERMSETRKSNQSKNLCISCGSKKHDSRSKRCEICYLKHISSNNFGSTFMWTNLQDIIRNQDNKCAYTGRNITLGVNTELDHILPRSKGGTDDPKNLQWVYTPVNYLKSSFKEDEFLSLIEEIYIHTKTKQNK